MCDTCGCGRPGEGPRYSKPGKEGKHSHAYQHSHTHTHGNVEHEHEHGHRYDHSHDHDPDHAHNHDHDHEHNHESPHEHDHKHPEDERVILIGEDIMSRNNLLAERNRGYFEARNVFAINWVSSPGSGKTTLLEKTILALKKEMKFCIIEGDQQSMIDAERIDKTGVPVIQVNTGSGCHLDARMVGEAVKQLQVPEGAVLMIENVGNLVCPALFDLGEAVRIVVVSVTEGDDKPLKYPTMFESSHLCLINKIDLLPYVDVRPAQIREYALQVNPHLEFLELSARTGEGLEAWIEWLRKEAGIRR
jgi:hydrogenase nickel incorporation protein HypB